MSYFLKKTNPSKKGVYLQIYQGYYIPKVGKRNKSFKKNRLCKRPNKSRY